MNTFSLVTVIVNRGYSDAVMKAARASGATGGTVLDARGTGKKETVTMLGFSVTPDKEVVLVLVDADKRDEVMKEISRQAGLNADGRGLIFSVPVEKVLGNGEKE